MPYWQNVILVKCVVMDGEGRERKQSSVAGKKEEEESDEGISRTTAASKLHYCLDGQREEKGKQSNPKGLVVV